MINNIIKFLGGSRMKPLIGITSSIEKDETAHKVYDHNVRAIIEAGGVPLLLPNISDQASIARLAEEIDGLLGSGGYDIDPSYYQEEPHQKLGTVTPRRDEFEHALFQKVLELNKPILGICRGMQMLNVAAGGKLYQDIYSQIDEELLKHSQDAPTYYGTHTIRLEEGSLLQEIVQSNELRVNSRHHQAVKEVAKDFMVSARARDGIIEAIESKEHSFALGVQWHPENMLEGKDEASELIFKAFINACKV